MKQEGRRMCRWDKGGGGSAGSLAGRQIDHRALRPLVRSTNHLIDLCGTKTLSHSSNL